LSIQTSLHLTFNQSIHLSIHPRIRPVHPTSFRPSIL
jgi:hypothetical protein